ncbi:hypothetical protein CTI12_AA593220 [Artemisia annua]|uniref:Uncharacterized protein n=1 Tax=Artemisia annua TaxID=35608 RepID=A0A2U1KK42_ARTAN|nr:hypothetical protein CTI12_AA593220 [Artemisia annua]
MVLHLLSPIIIPSDSDIEDTFRPYNSSTITLLPISRHPGDDSAETERLRMIKTAPTPQIPPLTSMDLSDENPMNGIVVGRISFLTSSGVAADLAVIIGDHLSLVSLTHHVMLRDGKMVVGPRKTLFMDEISIALDSSTTFQIVKCNSNGSSSACA